MKSTSRRVLLFILLAALTASSIAQTRDDVNRAASKPKDTSAPKKPRYINVDTTKPVPVETKTLVRSVLRLKNIYTNPDALAICRILNPDIYQHDSTLSDHTIILPNLPDPPSEIRRSVKDNFKSELRSNPEVNRIYGLAAIKFDTLANLFSVTEFAPAGEDTGNVYLKIKKFLPPLANLVKQSADNTRRTSQKTVNTLSTEVDALNKMLQESIERDQVSLEEIHRIYSLMADINILTYLINDRKSKIDSLTSANPYPNNNIYLSASYSVPVQQMPAESGDDDPQKFNIYVFRKSILETTGERNPEMDLYTVSYVIPALENDPIHWSTIPKMASTTTASFAPARFKFSIKDNRTAKIYTVTADLFDAEKDPNERWTLMDLINPHPVYRLMFLIP